MFGEGIVGKKVRVFRTEQQRYTEVRLSEEKTHINTLIHEHTHSFMNTHKHTHT